MILLIDRKLETQLLAIKEIFKQKKNHHMPIYTVIFLILTFLISSLKAEEEMQLEGLSKEMIIEWDGQHNKIDSLQHFCFRVNNPASVKNHDKLQYKLNIKSNHQLNHSFSATNQHGEVLIELYLFGHGQLEKIQAGKDININGASAICDKNNLSLKVLSTDNLERLTEGEYLADLNLSVQNQHQELLFEDKLTILIKIPAVTILKGDREVSLGTFNFEDIKQEAKFCYYRNAVRFYNLKIESMSARKEVFELSQQNTSDPKTLEYYVSVKAGNRPLTPVKAGEIIHNLPSSKHPDCADGNNLLLQIGFLKKYATTSSAGMYWGKIRLTFEVQ